MSELGRQLQEARTARGLSLVDVESTTRIRQKYLEALEVGEYARLPRGTIARGFLRTYAAFLGLDVPAAMNLYSQESGDEGNDVPVAEPGKPRLLDYRPLEVELIDDVPGARWWPWAVALLIVAVLAGAVWFFLNRNPGWNPLAAVLPPATSTATTTNTPTPWVVTATPKPASGAQAGALQASQTAAVPTPTSDLLPLPTPTVPASPTFTPRPMATPEVVARIALQLATSQRAWVRVTVDGEVAEEAILDAGTTRDWNANESITIRTGNAGGVTIILNGEDLGVMGRASQVLERTWVVDQGEVTESGGTAVPTPTSAG